MAGLIVRCKACGRTGLSVAPKEISKRKKNYKPIGACRLCNSNKVELV